MSRMPYMYLLPLLVLLFPLLLWMDLVPGDSKQTVTPPALPQVQQRGLEGLLETILAKNLWDKERGQLASANGESTGSAVGLIKCDLKGIAYAQMQPPQAMFACNGKLTLLQEGAELPDKSLLREIQPDHVVVEKASEMHNEYLFGKKQESKSEPEGELRSQRVSPGRSKRSSPEGRMDTNTDE